MKAKVLAHMEYSLRRAPFELYGHNKFCETTLFRGKFSNLNQIFKTQKGQLLLGQKLSKGQFKKYQAWFHSKNSTINFIE